MTPVRAWLTTGQIRRDLTAVLVLDAPVVTTVVARQANSRPKTLATLVRLASNT